MKIQENALTAAIYTKLRNTGPFMPYLEDDIDISLKNSLYSIVIYDDLNNAIGIARIIGDNRITFIIKDVVVLPEYQKQGIGELLIKYLFAYISKHACENAYIGLMSTIHKEGFYEKYGFIRRPNEKYGSGMVMFYKKENFK
ncbi:GNAT family N-acetyltransferase [Candidatus Izimaplasma bacterium ZiA1]|uniref:GNAT family N-acetyltransferase n=1 Tax=Candidatus Izimoplasma sp. ZiA1 TaxID=2024899 RepID=UPI000BAA39CA|nr:GNAT family N-acetyltransferase [Candidatus Izimaplasma bacterium ZiA1]